MPTSQQTEQPQLEHVRRFGGRSKRHGAATVELAVLAPIMVLLVLATIDACSMIFLKQTLTIAAYEGGRTALVPGTAKADIELDAQNVLDDRGVAGSTIVINPNNLNSVGIGDPITVTVSAPCDSNAILPGFFFAGRNLSAKVEVMKEYD